MSSEREQRMAEILQRFAEWDTQILTGTPIQVLKQILTDAEDVLEEFGYSRFPVRAPKPMEPPSESSGETSEPNKTLPPEDH